MSRKPKGRTAGEAAFWASPNFTWAMEEAKPFRSFPFPRDRLERLAHKLGVSDEELRTYLYEEIERRANGPNQGLNVENPNRMG
jgi:hypothetical protein